MFVRVTRTVADLGVLVRPSEIGKVVNDPQVDWYRSAYTYGEDAKEYWEVNGQSIKGYTGETYSSELWFDLDCESNPAKAKKASVDLVEHLYRLGWDAAIEIFFSGFKGFHIIVHTKNRFIPSEVSIICYNLAKEAGIPIGNDGVFDTSVYNITRIFRLPHTKHQKTGLYKIPLTFDELKDLKIEEIKKLASEPRYEEFDIEKADAEFLKEKYKALQKEKPALQSVDGGNVSESINSAVDFAMCPPGHRRCIYALEQGDIAPSQRHEAILRLAAFYKAQGFSREHSGDLIFEALERRQDIYLDANQTNEAECNRDIDQVFNKDWKGGMYTCKTDVFLQQKCDHGNGPCYNDARVKMRSVMTMEQLYHKYVKYGEEALIEYPKFGIPWIDERVRLRPRNFSVLAGANGCHRKGEKVLMYDGSFKEAERVVVGDQLMGPDSTPRTVQELFRGEDEMYRITPRKGEEFYVNGDHILHYMNSHYAIRQQTVKDFVKTHPTHDRFTSGEVMFRSAVEFPHHEGPIDPYFLGLWLGDGSSHLVAITTADQEIREYIDSVAKVNGLVVKTYSQEGNKASTYTLTTGTKNGGKERNTLLEEFKCFELINNKHIPNFYKINSRQIRLQVLAGLLDSDGYLGTNCFEITSKNERLADDILYLSRSLGFAAYKVVTTKHCTYKGEKREGQYFKISLSGDTDQIPTKLKRKQATKRLQTKNVLNVGFKVEKVSDKEEYFGFMLDKDHLYLDDSFNVLHNSGKTSIMFELMESLNKQKIYHAFFSLDMADSSVFEKLGAKYTPYSQRQIEAAFNVNTKNSTIMKEVFEAVKKNLPYTLIDFTSAATLQYIETTTMALKQIYENLQLVIVDYAGRLIGEFENQYASSTQNAMTANDVAKRTSCHFIYLAQVSRENGDHTDALRSSRVSKDSGAWEENATCVFTCWRPLGNGIDGKDQYIHIYVAKNRSGPLGENVFGWDGKTGKVSELRQDQFDDYCVELEQLGLDRPKFSWFDDPSKEKDDKPVMDYSSNKSSSKIVTGIPDGPKIRSSMRIKSTPEVTREAANKVKELEQAVKDASPEVKRLAQEQKRDDEEANRNSMRTEDVKELRGSGSFTRFR